MQVASAYREPSQWVHTDSQAQMKLETTPDICWQKRKTERSPFVRDRTNRISGVLFEVRFATCLPLILCLAFSADG